MTHQTPKDSPPRWRMAARVGISFGILHAFKSVATGCALMEQSLWWMTVSLLMLILIPIFGFIHVRTYRGRHSGWRDPFSFAEGFYYTVELFAFAGILLLPAQYFFYEASLPQATPALLATLAQTGNEALKDLVQANLAEINRQPIEQLLLSDYIGTLLQGSIYGIIYGLLLKRK